MWRRHKEVILEMGESVEAPPAPWPLPRQVGEEEGFGGGGVVVAEGGNVSVGDADGYAGGDDGGEVEELGEGEGGEGEQDEEEERGGEGMEGMEEEQDEEEYGKA